jgi:hypothetical protein
MRVFPTDPIDVYLKFDLTTSFVRRPRTYRK